MLPMKQLSMKTQKKDLEDCTFAPKINKPSQSAKKIGLKNDNSDSKNILNNDIYK